MASMYREPDLTDADMLSALCSSDSERITEQEHDAFTGMLEDVKRGHRHLAPRQREWAERAYKRVEADAARVQNLHSRGIVKGRVNMDDVLAAVPAHLRHPTKPPTRGNIGA